MKPPKKSPEEEEWRGRSKWSLQKSPEEEEWRGRLIHEVWKCLKCQLLEHPEPKWLQLRSGALNWIDQYCTKKCSFEPKIQKRYGKETPARNPSNTVGKKMLIWAKNPKRYGKETPTRNPSNTVQGEPATPPGGSGSTASSNPGPGSSTPRSKHEAEKGGQQLP